MTENELLLAISNIVDDKMKANIQPLRNDLDIMRNDIDAIWGVLHALQSDMHTLQSDMHTVKVELLENNALPRLCSIEQHYVATSNRYINSTEAIDAMRSDIVIIKKVVREHSEILQKIS